MTPWTNHTEVEMYAATKWDALNVSAGVPFSSQAAFDSFIDATLIPRAQSHINRFCKRDFDVDFPGAIPPAIQDVAARAAANMIQYMVRTRWAPWSTRPCSRSQSPSRRCFPRICRTCLLPGSSVTRTRRQAPTEPIRLRRVGMSQIPPSDRLVPFDRFGPHTMIMRDVIDGRLYMQMTPPANVTVTPWNCICHPQLNYKRPHFTCRAFCRIKRVAQGKFPATIPVGRYQMYVQLDRRHAQFKGWLLEKSCCRLLSTWRIRPWG